MKKYFIIYLAMLFFYGCSGSYFLKDDIIKEFSSKSDSENHSVYFKKKFEIDYKGRLTVSSHQVIKLSRDIKSRPQSVSLHLSSVDDLNYFHARLIKKDGSTITYDKRDLYTINLSSRKIVSNSTLYSLLLNDVNMEGDLIEVAYGNNSAFSPLGFSFGLDEAGPETDDVYCEIIAPGNYKINYVPINDTIRPDVISVKNNISYNFHWKDYKSSHADNPLQKLNAEPGIICSFHESSRAGASSWKEIGNWYIDLISDKLRANDEINTLAKELTKGLTDPKDKMDAIFNYCQKNIRYEQVYIEGGEIIPNQCSVVLQRKFGDCKDYSAIIYALARSIGLNANLALCYRGRGIEFYNIPASQFNHMIVNYFYNGKDYWYDGTNRISQPGLTTFDLANQMALVIEKDNSRLVKIDENEDNLFKITGILKDNKDGFAAELKLLFTKQYAIDFLYGDILLNRSDMNDFLNDWLKENLCRNIVISDMKWSQRDSGTFEIILNAKLPNSFTKISPVYYTSISKIFPELIYNGSVLKDEEVFYYPKLNSINIDLTLPDMQNADSSEKASLKYSYRLPIGPFVTESSKADFVEKYKNIYSELNQKNKFIIRKAK